MDSAPVPRAISLEKAGVSLPFQFAKLLPASYLEHYALPSDEQAVNVVAVRDITKLKLDKDSDPEFDGLTAVLAHPVDMSRLMWEFLGGLLEVTVPKVARARRRPHTKSEAALRLGIVTRRFTRFACYLRNLPTPRRSGRFTIRLALA